MMVRRSTTEAFNRANERISLATRIAAALPKTLHRPAAAAEDGESRSIKATNHQVQQLANGALHCVRKALSAAGVNASLSSDKVDVTAADRSAHLFVIKTATVKVAAEIPWADGTKLSKKIASLQVAFDAGRYTVQGVLNDSHVVPLTKAAFHSAAKEESTDGVNEEESIDPSSAAVVKKKAMSERTAQVLLQKPESTEIVQADPEAEDLRNKAKVLTSSIQEILRQVDTYSNALAGKTASELGIPAASLTELQMHLGQVQGNLEKKLHSIEQNFIRFADDVTYAKVQAARLNDASWKDMIDAAKTRGKGAMARIAQILDKVSIIFKKLTADVKIKEYGPGELTEKEMKKLVKKNIENIGKVNEFQESQKQTGPLAQRYFNEAAEGGIVQSPGFKGAAKHLAQATQLEFDFVNELLDALEDKDAELESLNSQMQIAIRDLEKAGAMDKAYPLPKTAAYKNTYNTGDKVITPLGNGTVVSMPDPSSGKLKVKLDVDSNPDPTVEGGAYTFTTFELRHASEEKLAGKAFHFTAAKEAHGGMGVRRTYAEKKVTAESLRTQGFAEHEIQAALNK